MSRDALAPYAFHGVDLPTVEGKEAIGTCPFCSKERHFYVNTETGQHNCKVCGAQGNAYTFLQKTHGEALKSTKKDDWLALSDLRSKLPWSIFKAHEIALHRDTGRWLIPLTNGTGSVSNLLTYDPSSSIPKPLGTAGCALHLYNGHRIKPAGPIYVCEGPWDAMALDWLLRKNGVDEGSYSVVAVPGASTFKKEWAEHFKGREVVLLYDNDTEGSAGMDKVGKLLGPTSAAIRKIVWPADFPEKYDIRDFVTSRLGTPKRAWIQLQALIPDKDKHQNKLTRKTLKSVMADFRKTIHMQKSTEEALTIVLAVVLSCRVPGDPIWLFLVGPPGSGKTLLIQSFLDSQHGIFISKLSKSALVSGYKDSEDVSILPQLKEMCLFVKDYTAIKSMPLAMQEELYGLLRDAYDGSVSIPFGNGIVRDYSDLYFSMVAGVTDVIHGDNRASLGERFLKLELLDEDHDPSIHIQSALSDVCETARDDQRLRDSVAAFLNRPFNPADLPTVPQWFKNRLIALAQIAAHLRATVERRGEDLLYRPRAEIGSRLAKQLAKLGRFVAYVQGKTKIDSKTYALIQRVALDTVVGFNLEILHALYSAPRGLTIPDLGAIMQLSHSTLARRLNDLQELRAIYRSADIREDKRGRPQYIWYMSPKLSELWKASAIEYTPPKLPGVRGGYTPKKRVKKKSSPKKKRSTV